MERKSFAAMHCSVAQCLEVVGEWWTLLIIRDAFLGVTRFDEFQQRLGISRNVLTQRLDHLVASGVLERKPYSEHPPRSDYRLTERGQDLWPVLNALRQWGDRHAAPDGPPIELVHERCGHVLEVRQTCSECGATVDARGVRAVVGPGAVEAVLPARARSTVVGEDLARRSPARTAPVARTQRVP